MGVRDAWLDGGPITDGSATYSARGFDAGKSGRRLRAIPTTSLAINSQIRAYGRNVVARSRYLAINNAYAAAAKAEYVAAVVGNGIKPSSLFADGETKKEIQKAFLRWTDESDADGLTDFYGQQAIIASEMFEAGECFVRLRPRFKSDGLSVPLQLQLLPCEMLPTDHNEILPNGRRIECGIQFSPIGKREGYWFLRQHPGEQLVLLNAQRSPREKVFVPAEEILHLYRPIRAGQIRGIPHTLAGMITLAMLDLYDDAELERKRVAALFAAFVTRPRGEDDEEHPFAGAPAQQDAFDSLSDFSLEPGAVIDLAEGQGIEFAAPADVGATYEAFEYRNLLRAAAGFGATYSGMTGDLRQTSYGSVRAGEIKFRRRVEQDQNHVLIFQLCRPVWRAWFRAAILSRAINKISAAQYLADPLEATAVKWMTPKWDWIDPLKDRQAEKLAVDSGFKARSDVIEAEGYDPEEVDARIKQDQDRADKLEISFITLSTSVVVGPDSQTAIDEQDASLVDPGSAAIDTSSDDFEE